MTYITLLLADEHALMRQALRQQLEQANDLVVVAEVDALDQVAELAQITAAEVAIVDVELVNVSGLDTCQPLLADCLQPKLVFLSTADRDVDLVCAWTAGGSAFVLKTVAISELIEVVHTVAATGRAFTPAQHQRIRTWQHEVAAKLAALTARQHDVLRGLIAGYTNSEIAEELVISVKTVEAHVSQVLAKLEASSRRQVIAWVRERHLML